MAMPPGASIDTTIRRLGRNRNCSHTAWPTTSAGYRWSACKGSRRTLFRPSSSRSWSERRPRFGGRHAGQL